MGNERPPRPLLLRPPLGFLLALLLTAAALGGVSAWVASAGYPLIGWPGVMVFSAGGVILLLAMLPASCSLRLDQTGFTVRHLFRSTAYRWDEVGAFAVAPSKGGPLVVFNFTDAEKVDPRASPSLAGFAASLPDTYGLGAAELAELLNEWRRRAAG